MLKLQYFGHLRQESAHRKRPWYWERLRAGGEGDSWGWDGWMASPTRWTWVWANPGRWWRTGSLACCSSWGHNKKDATVWLNKRKKKEKRREKRERRTRRNRSRTVTMMTLPHTWYFMYVALFNYHEMPEKIESIGRLCCVWLFVTPWTAAHPAPLSMGFSRQEWVAIPFSRESSWSKKELSSLFNYHKMSLS